ncbi:MAG TPA: hypothetical protein VNB23_14125 [Ramlibacter sp.]|nr:hypothetical protein [Ramlibacter sp.]
MNSPNEPNPTLEPARIRQPTLRRSLVAVLPFSAQDQDEGLRLLGAELADVLREQLGRDPAMQAILISSDFLAQAPVHAVELICRELGVGYVITGKCHFYGESPSLYVELTDTREWHIRWANFYRGQAHALLAGEGELMAGMVHALRRTLAEHPPR